jgi:hypothetical protein
VKILALSAGVLSLLALTGCAGNTAESAASTPTPTPTVKVATENEVASVIAEYASDWRDTIDSASDCRIVYVTGSDPAREYICETGEETIGITAGLVSRDLRKLNVPDSMQTLVTDTDTILSKINLVDVKSLCGDDGWNNAGPDCNSALAERYSLYTQLESKLDAWSPYL